MEGAAGTATRISQIMDDNLNGALLSVKSAAEGAVLALGRLGLDSALTQGARSLANAIRFLASNIDAVVTVAGHLIAILAVSKLYAIARGFLAAQAGSLSLAGGLRTAGIAAARFFRKFLVIVAITEGILLVIDTIRLLVTSASGAADAFIGAFILPILDGLTNFISGILEVRRVFSSVFGAGGVLELPERVDLAAALFSQETLQSARRGGEMFWDQMVEGVKDRLRAIGLIPEADLDVAIAALKPPELPIPAQIQPPGVPGGASEARGGAFRSESLNVEREIRREIEDTRRVRERALETIGLEGEALAIIEARQAVIARFENERLRITRETEDATSMLARATVAEVAARASGDAARENAARKAAAAAEIVLAGLRTENQELERQIASRFELAQLAEHEARAGAAQDALRSAYEATSQAIDNASTAVGNFATQAITGFNDAAEAARQLGRTILNDVINQLIAAPISNFLSQSLSGFFPVPAAQHGGLGHGLTLVGEAGPELVDFRNPGRVYTNEQLAAALDGSGREVTVNYAPTINNSDEAAVERALLTQLPLVVDVVRGAVLTDRRRPSALNTPQRR